LIESLSLHRTFFTDAHRLNYIEGIHGGYLLFSRVATFSKAALVNTSLSQRSAS
jgi:hypothetical protein